MLERVSPVDHHSFDLVEQVAPGEGLFWRWQQFGTSDPVDCHGELWCLSLFPDVPHCPLAIHVLLAGRACSLHGIA